MKRLLTICLTLVMLLSLAACGGGDPTSSAPAGDTFVAPEGYTSVILVTINPQFKLYLDADGAVLAVEPVNEDAKSIVAPVNTHTGSLKTVMEELVTAVKDGGFVKEEAKATVTITVAERADTVAVADVNAALQQVEQAADAAFEALEIEVESIVAPAVENVTTIADTTKMPATTTTTAATTTTTTTKKPTTTTTTKKPTTTTTTKAPSYTAVTEKNGSWEAMYRHGENLYSAGLTLFGAEEERGIGLGIGDPLSSLPEEVREDMKPDCYLYEGEYFYFGRGDGDGLSAIAENGTTVTLTDFYGHTLTLTRTGETTLKVTSAVASFGPLSNIPAGLTFTFTTE